MHDVHIFDGNNELSHTYWFTKKIKCYIHMTQSQGSPTLESAPGSKTEIFYVISSEKKEFSFVNCGNKT